MDIERAKEILTGLAQGIDPLTGELLSKDHVCNQAEIIRAFYCILGELDKSKDKPEKKQPENAGKPWIQEDDAYLCKMFDEGVSRREMCSYFKRSGGAIASRLVRLGKIESRDEIQKN